MVKIRLMRIGATKRPFYRIVVIDERKKRNGEYLDLIGTYNPLTEPKEIKIDQAKVDAWVKKGAVLSDGFLRVIGKAPQKPPRKAKKEKAAPKEAEAPKAEDDAVIPSEVEESADKDTNSTEIASEEPRNDEQAAPEEVVVTEEAVAEDSAPEAETVEVVAEEEAPKEETQS